MTKLETLAEDMAEVMRAEGFDETDTEYAIDAVMSVVREAVAEALAEAATLAEVLRDPRVAAEVEADAIENGAAL